MKNNNNNILYFENKNKNWLIIIPSASRQEPQSGGLLNPPSILLTLNPILTRPSPLISPLSPPEEKEIWTGRGRQTGTGGGRQAGWQFGTVEEGEGQGGRAGRLAWGWWDSGTVGGACHIHILPAAGSACKSNN